MKAPAAGLVRAVVLAVIPSAGYQAYTTRFSDAMGADIGGALMVFMVLVLGAFLWSWFDAVHQDVRTATRIWVWAGVGCFLSGAIEWTVIGDLDGVGPALSSGVWNLVLLSGGAACGLTLGWLLDRGARR